MKPRHILRLGTRLRRSRTACRLSLAVATEANFATLASRMQLRVGADGGVASGEQEQVGKDRGSNAERGML
jgi:hypothetical protein